jgi:hypothetical protein
MFVARVKKLSKDPGGAMDKDKINRNRRALIKSAGVSVGAMLTAQIAAPPALATAMNTPGT